MSSLNGLITICNILSSCLLSINDNLELVHPLIYYDVGPNWKVALEPDYTSLDPEERTNKFLAIFSVLLGVISFCAGLIPIAGIAVALIATVMAIFGLRSEHRKIAILGLVISTLGLLTSVTYMILKSLNVQL